MGHERANWHMLIAAAGVVENCLVQISKEDGTSINQFMATAVAEKICAMKTAEFFASRGAEGDVRTALSILNREGGQTPTL